MNGNELFLSNAFLMKAFLMKAVSTNAIFVTDWRDMYNFCRVLVV